ncbi:MAG: RluA family pseudouridine synthase [Lachnospiraceae bacterium]
MEVFVQVKEQDSKIRIDKYLAEKFPERSRSFFQKILEKEQILVNDLIPKSNYQVKFQDLIRVNIPDAVDVNILPENIPLDIIYEDADFLIINKPKGMVVHPSAGHESGTLVNAIMYHCKEELSGINGEIRPGIVHRIDRDTTGALIICKNDTAHVKIAQQIKEHTVTRCYRGLVTGIVKEEEGTIQAPIGRSKSDRKKMAVVPDGREAVTHYRVLERFKDTTYMEFQLETGRTHQIRVHMASIHHPILGDEVYGKKIGKLTGQTLHAMTIGFIHPSLNKYVEFEAPLPDYFLQLLKKYRQ